MYSHRFNSAQRQPSIFLPAVFIEYNEFLCAQPVNTIHLGSCACPIVYGVTQSGVTDHLTSFDTPPSRNPSPFLLDTYDTLHI